MGYRNQPTSASGVKDVSDKGPTFQDRALLENEKREAERKRLAEINKKREESNWRIEQEESLYSADLQAGIRTAANKTNVDYTSLNDSMSNMVSQLSAARIRLKQSSGPYEEMDPEGNVVFNTQTDKAYIKSATDFIKNSETNFGSVAYIQEEFKKMPSGNGEGETSRKFTSPYLGLLNAASNPASGQDVSVSYDMEYDNKSGHRMGIVMKGEAVRRLNAEMGNEGDTYTIKPEEVTNLMMGNNDPENFGLFYQNPSTVSELEKKAATNGILDPKDGRITSDYMIEVKTEEPIVDELTGTEQMATVSQVNYPVIKQNMAGAIKSKLMTTLDKGMVSTSVLINTYAKQDEDGNYYYDTPRKDGNGNIIYKADGKVDFGSVNEDGDTRNRVYLGDGELEFDMSSDNESFGGLSEDDYKNVYGLIENEFMKRSGVYDPQVVKPYGEKMTVERGLSRAERTKKLADGGGDDLVSDLYKITEVPAKDASYDSEEGTFGSSSFNLKITNETMSTKEYPNGVIVSGVGKDSKGVYAITEEGKVYDNEVVDNYENMTLSKSDKTEKQNIQKQFEKLKGLEVSKTIDEEKVRADLDQLILNNLDKEATFDTDNEDGLIKDLKEKYGISASVGSGGLNISGTGDNVFDKASGREDIIERILKKHGDKILEYYSKETVEATGAMEKFNTPPKKKVETGNNQTVVQEEEPVVQEPVVQEPVVQEKEPIAQVVKKTTTNPPNTKSNKGEEEQESFLLNEEVTGGGRNGNEVVPLPQYENSKAAYNYLNSKTQVKMGSGGDGRAAEYGDKNKKMGLKVDLVAVP